MIVSLVRNCLARGGRGHARSVRAQYSTESLAQFPGARAAYTNNLEILIPDVSKGIPIYRVMGRDGKVIDESHDPNIAEEEMVHMYKSMENHLDERFGPVEDFFRDDYFLASMSQHQR